MKEDMSAKNTKMVDTALTGLQQLVGQIKNQPVSWVNYINFQSQGEVFDIPKLLRSAFFMQSIVNGQLFFDYEDCIKMTIQDLENVLKKNYAIPLYFKKSEDSDVQRLYHFPSSNTVLWVVRRSNFEWLDIDILTFDETLLNTLKLVIFGNDQKEKDVKMETS